jgi:FemAB-related protein (PEP-CTERM system-associated)
VATFRPFIDADRESWDAYVRGRPESHPGQLTAWRTLTATTYGSRPVYWLAEDGGRVTGILPLFEKRRLGRLHSLFSAPGGLLADDEPTARGLLAPLVERVRAERLAWLELRDQRHSWPDLATTEEHCTQELALAPDAEAQWAGFDAKLRNQIRKGEKAGLAVRWGHDQLDAFWRVMLENMRDLGTPWRGVAYFRRALECFGDAARVLVVGHGDEPVGAMFLVVHGDRAVDLWASSLRRHFALCPNQVLYWEAMQAMIRAGVRRFDFGRSQWDSPTFHFKEQWGARAIPLSYQYALGTAAAAPRFAAQRQGFDLAVRGWKRLPLPVARWLGEPVRRLFPELM